jgi:hypothetical protein
MLLIPTLLCPKSWEEMSGNETQRFCSHCKKHVHNLDALSVSERLALLSSPAGSLCSRYQVAIRRPAKGQEESYALHLAKHGAGVVVVGSVLVVLWEMHGQAEKERYYRAAKPTPIHAAAECPMPSHLYCEQLVFSVGMIAMEPCPPPGLDNPIKSEAVSPLHVDLKIDPTKIDGLFDQIKPATPKPPLVELLRME